MEVIRTYIETSIISFYHEIRQAADMVARRHATRRWWDKHAANHRLVTSRYVMDELEDGNYPFKADAVKMLGGLTQLEDVTDDISSIVRVYLKNKVMPMRGYGDAYHLAMASYHQCHYLLTWNCKHLANPNKFGHIRKVNADLGLFVPRLVTPDDLLEEAQDV